MANPIDPSTLADIVAASGHIGYHWDLQTGQLLWFGPWQQLFGTGGEQPPHNAETFAKTVYPDDHYLVFSESPEAFDREFRFRLPDGRIVWVCEHGTTDYEGGRAARQRGLLRVIDAPKQRSLATAQGLRERDLLTGRLTREAMVVQIGRVLSGPKDIKQGSAYLAISIDKMSFVNEAVGTKAADALLCGVSDRLGDLCPTKAIIGRTGGDMFGILLPGLSREAHPLIERLLHSFRNRPVTANGEPIHITVSIGSVRLTDLAAAATAIMIRAEQALTEARRRGRNQHVEYRESPQRAQENRAVLEIAERVKVALKQEKLRLAFQPVIDTETGQVLFYEALARLFRDDGRTITAADFIPVVEQQGLALEFDRHVLNLAVREMESYDKLRLAVNISGLTAAQADWPAYVESVLQPRPDVARRLIVEITETAAIMDVAETRRLAESLNRMGSQVALDDFGAGSTSIRHLRTLPLSIMKIDRDLLLSLIGNSEQQHLVRMLISIARGLGLKTVAEGVETEDVARWLREEKVDMMQGYYFGRPSLDRPWLELKGAEASEDRAFARLGLPLPEGKTAYAEIHAGSFLR